MYLFNVVYKDEIAETIIAPGVTRTRALDIAEYDFVHFTKVSMHKWVYDKNDEYAELTIERVQRCIS